MKRYVELVIVAILGGLIGGYLSPAKTNSSQERLGIEYFDTIQANKIIISPVYKSKNEYKDLYDKSSFLDEYFKPISLTGKQGIFLCSIKRVLLSLNADVPSIIMNNVDGSNLLMQNGYIMLAKEGQLIQVGENSLLTKNGNELNLPASICISDKKGKIIFQQPPF